MSGYGKRLALPVNSTGFLASGIPIALIMRSMSYKTRLVLILGAVVLAACAEKGEKVYRTWVGPDRSNMAIVTLQLGPDVKDVTIRERDLPRSEYGTLLLVPGKYTLFERDDANIGIVIRPVLIDATKARARSELILGHTYVLHAGKSDGKRALWIEDARSGEVFIDTR